MRLSALRIFSVQFLSPLVGLNLVRVCVRARASLYVCVALCACVRVYVWLHMFVCVRVGYLAEERHGDGNFSGKNESRCCVILVSTPGQTLHVGSGGRTGLEKKKLVEMGGRVVGFVDIG